jgi:hypothetical protein
MPGFGDSQAEAMKDFPHTHALLALLRDGFHAQSPGGQVKLRSDSTPVLDYPSRPFVMDGARRALLSMAEIQFAAGAKQVVNPAHEKATPTAAGPRRARPSRSCRWTRSCWVRSAHVMGGCAMAAKPELGVVRPDGRTGRWTTCRCTTARSSPPASAPTRSCRSTAWPTSWPRNWPRRSAGAACRANAWPGALPMLARLQQAITLGGLLLAPVWGHLWWHSGHPLWVGGAGHG